MTRPWYPSRPRAAHFWLALLVSSALILLFASPVLAVEAAESADSPDLTLHVNVREVGIIFSALRHHNQALPGLTADDVTVLDQGVPAQVTSVSTAELPIRLGLLIDASASVDKKLETEVSIATDFATRFVRSNDKAMFMTFATKPEPMVEISSPADVGRELKAVDAAGLTAVYDSVIEACAELTGPGAARKVAILLTDGEDTNSYHTPDQVVNAVERSGAVVYTIFIRTRTSGRDGERWMKRLAEATGGRAFQASGPRDLQSALAEIERDIRSGYVLTFRPPTEATGGSFHQVSIVPRQRDISIRAQAGYVPR